MSVVLSILGGVNPKNDLGWYIMCVYDCLQIDVEQTNMLQVKGVFLCNYSAL